MAQFVDFSKRSGEGLISLKRDLKHHLKVIQSCQKHLFKISETTVDIADVDTDASTDKIWKKLDANFNA